MYGVEFQANAVQALLWGEYKQEAGDGLQLAVLFAALLLGMWGFWRRKVAAAAALWAALCVISLVGGGALIITAIFKKRS